MEPSGLFTSIASKLPVLQSAACVLAGLLFVFYLLRPILSPLRSIPGPFLARYTDAWFLWRVHRGHLEQDFVALHRKYESPGAIVRYGPNRYSFKDLEAPKIIYGHGHSFIKSSFYRPFARPGQENWSMFSVDDPKIHSQLRRHYQSTYSLTSLVSYEPHVDECARLFKQRLEEIAVGGLPIDFAHWLQCYAFDVIGLITYGSRFGFLDRGEDVKGIISAVGTLLQDGVHVGVYPTFHVPTSRLRGWLSGKNSGAAYVVAFTQQHIDQFRASSKTATQEVEKEDDGKVETFLEKYLRKHESDPTNFTHAHIFNGCSANVVAGSDTTGISLAAIFYYLLKRPDCYQKLREEADAVQPSPSKEFTFQEAQAMPYLQAVIKEALRIHPAFGLPLERVVPQGGATIAGRFFPASVRIPALLSTYTIMSIHIFHYFTANSLTQDSVSVHCWVENRNELIFEDPDEFRPERWLTTDTEKLTLMNRHSIPFGLGTRTCIGRHISMLEISKLVPRIVRDWDFHLQERADQMWETENITFVKPQNFMVTVAARGR
ncbi:cytochrome P450 protein [Rutstroemia sp. NJR-2017a WRK4]|nr:cytochrome P450 protein [Rutstroemia sp. NJR-2017a WRK4]